MPDAILYTADARSTGDGRDGHVASSDGRIDLDMAMPPEMGGSGQGANPEELFAAGYAACFHSSLRQVARRGGTGLTGSTVTVRVGIGPQGEGFGLTVTLLVDLPGVDRAAARQLADSAHQVCPYSRATRGNIPVTVEIA